MRRLIVKHLGGASPGDSQASTYRMAFAEMRADNDFYAFCYGWQHYRCNEMCHRCWASFVNPDLPWTDFRSSAGWRKCLIKSCHYKENSAVGPGCPLVDLPGWELTRNLIDPMHGLNLGVDQHVAGNVLWDMATEACTMKKDVPGFLERQWVLFMRWCSEHRISCSMKRFTVTKLNKSEANKYPLLHCKAAEARIVLVWLCEMLTSEASEKPRCAYTQLKATCCWSICQFHHLCKIDSDPLPLHVKDECVRLLGVFLDTYSALARFCVDLGDPGWHLVPKHHYLAHLRDDIATTSFNPMFHHCFVDEDMVGRVARGSRMCHRSTVTVRWLERYIHFLWLRWRQARTAPAGIP